MRTIRHVVLRSTTTRVALLAFALPVIFAAITQHAWEDYFITLRTSRNLVAGHGLVFTPGEKLHTFTSPLGVLVPAFCTALTGIGREEAALWIFRVISAGFLAASAGLVWRRFDTLGIGPIGRLLFFGIILVDAKLLDFSMNGMETAMLVFFAILLWQSMESPAGPHLPTVGIACAGLLWTRPDAFILGAALILPTFVFRRDRRGPRPWSPLIRGALLGGLLYLPWFVWAWSYYGSPIPHTVIAKSVVTPPLDWRAALQIPWQTLLGRSLLPDLFLPAYWAFGGWPAVLEKLAHFLSALAAFAWVAPRMSAPARRASLGVFIGMFYLCAIVLFPWYSPPWTVLASLALALAADHLSRLAAPKPWAVTLVRVSVATIVLVQFAVTAAVTRQMQVQQELIENQTRRAIALWLRDHAQPTDTVFLEPLGYIGYYSNLQMRDYPGLSSPAVSRVIRGGARRFTEVIGELKPTWLVLRPFEIADPTRPENAAAWRHYEHVRTWSIRDQLDAIELLPGRAWLMRDAEFRVFRRRE